jgi:mono/diheme cytochrome c family protein
VTSRFRLAFVVGCSLTLAGPGCDSFNAGTVEYRANPRVAADLKDKPQLQGAITKALADLYGPSPAAIKVPAGSGLREGGRYLANYEDVDGDLKPLTYVSSQTGEKVQIGGGYGLYRRYCLHCHGVDGGGDGPTAAFLYPRPRDYRPGKFKFTSVAPSNPKPTRDDLRKTIKYGLHGTSMPAFEALMSGVEVEQVVDYVVFLSMRGETELALIDEAKIADKDDPSLLPADTIKELAGNVMNNWKATETLVVAPTARRTPPTRESVLHGRDMFLGFEFIGPNNQKNKTACTDCHGIYAVGNGTSFIEKALFDKIVFQKGFYGGEKISDEVLDKAIEERFLEVEDEEASLAIKPGEEHHEDHRASLDSEKFKEFKARMKTAWNPGSLDDWGNPLRPANLNLGVYKGGRRPIDLYWRITKGINGAKMPAHSNLMTDAQVWDVVNFILALPYEPALLADAEALRKKAGLTTPAPAPAAASNAPAGASVASAPR